MKLYWKLPVIIILFTTLSCTDGSQAGQKLTQLLKDEKIERVVIVKSPNLESKTLEKKEYLKNRIKIDNQFIQIEDEYINLSYLRVMKINGKALEIVFD